MCYKCNTDIEHPSSYRCLKDECALETCWCSHYCCDKHISECISCDQLVCEDCETRCACNSALCQDNTDSVCVLCENLLCDYCTHTCDQCEKTICQNCVQNCDKCMRSSKYVCDDCFDNHECKKDPWSLFDISAKHVSKKRKIEKLNVPEAVIDRLKLWMY